MSALLAVARRDLLLAMRRKAEVLTALFFFVIVTSLFPLGIGPEPALLRKIAPGVLWVGALLATMLGLQRMFAADHADGTLEQMALSPHPVSAWASGKVAAHWVASGLPLTVLSPLLGLQYGLAPDTLGVLALALLVGTPVLSLLGAACAALTLGARGGGMLLALIALPLFVPILVFGAGAAEAQAAGLDPTPHLSILAAGLLVALVGVPAAVALAIRIALE